jgi:osmotically-inducible protein OsmY
MSLYLGGMGMNEHLNTQLSTQPSNDPARRWHALRGPLAKALWCAAMVTGLQGCIELAVGSAVVGTIAASDRRTLGAQTEDKAITLKAGGRVGTLLNGKGHININSFNRRALLTGEVKDEATKAAVEREVKAIEGVELVFNEIAVSGSASYTSRSNDVLITGKVKASLVDSRDISTNSFKVVTENGIVYLMGRVTQREGDQAAEVTRNIGGVHKVVKLFEYISDDELQEINKTTTTTKSPSASN